MNANEAINKLKQLRDNRQKEQSDNTSNAFAKSLNTFKNIIVGTMSDLAGLLLQNEPNVTVKNFPKDKKTEKELIKMNLTLEKIALTLETMCVGQMVKSPKLNKKEKEVVIKPEVVVTKPKA